MCTHWLFWFNLVIKSYIVSIKLAQFLENLQFHELLFVDVTRWYELKFVIRKSNNLQRSIYLCNPNAKTVVRSF
jgi:hypothetical protein